MQAEEWEKWGGACKLHIPKEGGLDNVFFLNKAFIVRGVCGGIGGAFKENFHGGNAEKGWCCKKAKDALKTPKKVRICKVALRRAMFFVGFTHYH